MNTMQKLPAVAIGLISLTLLVLVFLAVWWLSYAWILLEPTAIVPGVRIANVQVDRLNPTETHEKLNQQLEPLEEFEIVLVNESEPTQQWATSSANLGWDRDLNTAISQAQKIGRQGNNFHQLSKRFQMIWDPIVIEIPHHLNEELVSKWVASVSAQIDNPGRPPQATATTYDYKIDPGELGTIVDQSQLISLILHNPKQAKFNLPMIEVNHPLNEQQLAESETRLQKLWRKNILVEVSEMEPTFTLIPQDYFPWLELPQGINRDKLLDQITAWNTAYERPPRNAKLEITPDQEITEFEPHQNGRALDQGNTLAQFTDTLAKLENQEPGPDSATIAFSFITVEPEIPLEKTNNLGIKELIGLGTSTYFGSIANRVYNVDLTSSRMHATLVAPGEEFSFNRSVGEVSARTGYRSAYIIRNGRTELGDGGGVCQVSTTIFRAALDAGMPITAWKAHSYRVGYYEQGNQPGYDATVYSPSTDFRFLNDTGHHLLIGSYADTANRFLRVEIWGTSDGRQAEIKNYYFGNQRPAPPPLYQEDPSLPPGTTKQIDWAAPGGTASFDYEVKTASGAATFNKTFRSVYQPWKAVYLVGPTQ